LIKLNKFFCYIINVLKTDLEKFAPATAQKNINLNILNSVIIPLPPLNEQKCIVEKVDSLMQLFDELKNKIQKSKEYTNRLMESILKQSIEA